jgi:hypothetical protein
MPDHDVPVRAALDEPPPAPPAPGETPSVAARLDEILVPGLLAVAAGGGILAIAVAWGAAEAAVGVGAAYLVYSAIVARGDLSGSLAVRLLTGVLRRPPADGTTPSRAR